MLVDELILDKPSHDDGGVEHREPRSLATQSFARVCGCDVDGYHGWDDLGWAEAIEYLETTS